MTLVALGAFLACSAANKIGSNDSEAVTITEAGPAEREAATGTQPEVHPREAAHSSENVAATPAHEPDTNEPESEESTARDAPVFAFTDWQYSGKDGSKYRVADANERKGEAVRKLFAEAGVEYPPRQLLFRAFKQEAELEVWAASTADASLVHVATYGICGQSGDLGPKRGEWDNQVPEGFYELDYFNRHSDYYLSMRVNYPNRSDRILKEKKKPGSAIMIHGKCASIGCLAMSDERIQELWLMAASMEEGKRTVFVHILPAKLWDSILADEKYSKHHAFWRNLKVGFDHFEDQQQLPDVSVDDAGVYKFE